MTPPHSRSADLVRVIGRWSLVALAVNSILGSGIFGLPSTVAGFLGRASPVAVLLGGCGMAVIVACYAELASQFTQTGGTYLYLRHAFGRLVGVQVGWLTLLGRLTACAASVNLLVVYLGEFWPAATLPLVRLLIIGVFIAMLAAVNYRGVAGGTRVSNVSVLAKLTALGIVCVAGVIYLATHPHAPVPPVRADSGDWLNAMLLLLFAYGGYEAALNPMAEAHNPRSDAAFALFVALATITAVYWLIQMIVVGVLPDPAHSARPLSDAAGMIMGPAGGALVAVAALVSIYGYLSANLLTGPRGMFALAEAGDFPRAFASVHPRFRTPYLSIVVFALLLWGFSQFASFSWNVTLSAVARLFYYAGVCVAVPVLRRRQPGQARFRVPGGLLLPVLGVAMCAVLMTRVDFSKSLVLLVTIALALLNWVAVHNRDLARSHDGVT
jgi:basic amino acid/polyamine antiporter, APA family